LKELQSANGIALDAFPTLIGESEVRASFAKAFVTRLVEHLGGFPVIAEHVLALLKPYRQLITRFRFTSLARLAQLLCLLITRMAGCDCDGCYYKEGKAQDRAV
jgi:hypothetical protein